MENNVIGVYPISNCCELLVYEIGEGEVLAGPLGQSPTWCKFGWGDEDGELVPGFYWGKLFIPFSKVERL